MRTKSRRWKHTRHDDKTEAQKFSITIFISHFLGVSGVFSLHVQQCECVSVLLIQHHQPATTTSCQKRQSVSQSATMSGSASSVCRKGNTQIIPCNGLNRRWALQKKSLILFRANSRRHSFSSCSIKSGQVIQAGSIQSTSVRKKNFQRRYVEVVLMKVSNHLGCWWVVAAN